jgi:hypothetical protein
MPDAKPNSTLPPRRKVMFIAITAALMALGVLLVGEIVARLFGYKPYATPKLDIRVEPGGRFFALKPSGGYAQLPGEFNITLPDGWKFHVTHDTNGLRLTHSPRTAAPRKPEMWIMGCSLTHGWSLNDEETYPWLVQEAMPAFEVVNGGVEGYGTLQSRLLFQELLEARGKPALVVLAYGTFQDFRNTMVRERRKSVVAYNRLGPLQQPYARFNGKGDFDYFMSPVEYTEFPLMRASALMHFAEQQYDRWEIRHAHSDLVTAELMRRWAIFCRDQGIAFVVAGISSDSGPMLEFLQKMGIRTVDISVPLREPGNTNLPHDNHPSAKANKEYARKLVTYLQESLARAKSSTNASLVPAASTATNFTVKE